MDNKKWIIWLLELKPLAGCGQDPQGFYILLDELNGFLVHGNSVQAETELQGL